LNTRLRLKQCDGSLEWETSLLETKHEGKSMKAIFVNEIKSLLHNGINGVLDRANGIGIVVSI
jgi:hypothetical protein